jgi:type I restriction enzyme S subunit
MPSTYNRHANSQTRTYNRVSSVVFLKTKEAFGGLSNMAGGFPLKVNGIRIRTSEALYQACRFPHLSEVQKLIITQTSPMTAKMKGKPHRANSRPDWDRVRTKIMRWCLRVKLSQNWIKFSRLLMETGERPIVEESRRDAFWGAKPVDEQTLVGMNVLGRLLMELREEVKSRDPASLRRVEPLDIPDFRIYDRQIQPVEADGITEGPKVAPRLDWPASPSALPAKPVQTSLFDQLLPISKTELRCREVEHTGGSIDDLKPYPAMKGSGVQWLGQVPKHWDILPNRAIFEEVKERGYPDEEMLSVTIKRGVILQKTLLFDSSKKDSSNQNRSAYKLVCPNDIAYNKMRAWQRAIGASKFRGIVSPAYVVMRLRKKYNPRYFHYLFRTPHFAKEAERWSYGITSDMWSLRPEHFKMIYTPLPPNVEQSAIVKFLDHAARRLNRAVRAKQKVIALLNEQKQVIVQRAVTRGLDPDMSLKPSGIPWLGDIPRHWDVLRCKYVFKEVDLRSTSGEETHLSMSQKFGLIPSSKIEGWRLVSASYVGAKLCEPGDLVLNRLKAHLGVFSLAQERGVVSPDYTVFRPNRPMEPRYFEAVFRTPACRVELRQRAKGIVEGFWRLYTDDFYDIRVPIPPVAEQKAIIETLGSKLVKLNSAITFTEREIALLQEFRTRLLADVVTGKVDVREAASRLPVETEEADPDMEVIDTTEEGFQESETMGEAYG